MSAAPLEGSQTYIPMRRNAPAEAEMSRTAVGGIPPDGSLGSVALPPQTQVHAALSSSTPTPKTPGTTCPAQVRSSSGTSFAVKSRSEGFSSSS